MICSLLINVGKSHIVKLRHFFLIVIIMTMTVHENQPQYTVLTIHLTSIRCLKSCNCLFFLYPKKKTVSEFSSKTWQPRSHWLHTQVILIILVSHKSHINIDKSIELKPSTLNMALRSLCFLLFSPQMQSP